LGGGVHGVDIMRDAKDGNKPHTIEINGCPGLAGIESVTGENVAKAIIDYVLENYQSKGRRKVTDSSGATARATQLEPFSEKSGFTAEERRLTKGFVDWDTINQLPHNKNVDLNC